MTASTVPLAMRCAPSHALPQVFTTNPAAERGTAIHAYVADALTEGATAALARVPSEYVEQCKAIDLGSIRALIGDGEPSVELTMAWDPVTDKARIVGTKLDRNYDAPRTEGEIFGTADLIIRRKDRIVLPDWKTGRSYVDWWQARTLAVLAYKVTGIDDITVIIAKLKDDGTWWPTSETYTAIDLDGFASEIRSRSADIAIASEMIRRGETPNVSAGEWCTYCPALQACPKTAIVRHVAEELGPYTVNAPALAPIQLGAAWVVLQRYKGMIEKIEEELRAIARQTPLPLPNGKTLREVEQSREVVNGDVAWTVLANQYGPDAAHKASEIKVTKESIKRALGEKAPEAIEAVRQAGGMYRNASMTVREVK